MKRLLLATAAGLIATSAAAQESANVGVILGFTGPLASITPSMAAGAELAFKEVSDSGALLDGLTLTPVRGDSTCIDAAAATGQIAQKSVYVEAVGADAPDRALEGLALLGAEIARPELEQALDDLKVVLHPVIDLAQEHLAL